MIQRCCMLLFASAVATAVAAQQPAPNPGPDSPRVTAIIEQARSAAGSEWTETVEFFCGTAGRAHTSCRRHVWA